jgi:hypothetical protein
MRKDLSVWEFGAGVVAGRPGRGFLNRKRGNCRLRRIYPSPTSSCSDCTTRHWNPGHRRGQRGILTDVNYTRKMFNRLRIPPANLFTLLKTATRFGSRTTLTAVLLTKRRELSWICLPLHFDIRMVAPIVCSTLNTVGVGNGRGPPVHTLILICYA